ncbi:MAG: DUF6079 family protein [Acidobacteriota bacterium]
MTSQQIKSYVALRQVDQITRFEAVSDEQVVRAYQFTDELRNVVARLLTGVASGSGAYSIVGERGTGKSHLLALTRSIANQPRLARILEDSEAASLLQETALQKLPSEGVATLTIGFDPDKGLNFLKAFPRAPGLEGELPAWISTDQLDELIERRITSAGRFALFIDGISGLLKHPKNGNALLEWLQYLACEAKAGRFCLAIALDQELLDSRDVLAEKLLSLFQLERINIANLVALIDQTIFRKTNPQRKGIEVLYGELRTRMPHFTGTLTEFTQLYPVHPVVLELVPAMRQHARTFSLFGFITAVAARAMVRRALNLICLDELFESFEFDLRKNSQLVTLFTAYDHIFSSVIPSLGQQHSLYAKMMLKGLLLLSLAGRFSTAIELADAVMLYDDHEPKQFREMIASIMERLMTDSPDIVVERDGLEPRYLLHPLQNNTSPLNASSQQLSRNTQLNAASFTQTDIPALEVITPISPLTSGTQENTPAPIMIPAAGLPASAPVEGKIEQTRLSWLAEAAKQIPDDDLRLDQLLIAAARKQFKDWPFIYETSGLLRDRVEINIKWRGSLRKGIFKFGGAVEIYSNYTPTNPIADNRPICEYDWQVTIFRAHAPMMMPPTPDSPSTLIFWQPVELTDQERLVLKQLLMVRNEGSKQLGDEEAKRLGLELETQATEIFTRVYLQQGRLLCNNGSELPLQYQSSTFINTLLTRLLDAPLVARYPEHPKLEELLDPDYVDEMAAWMFDAEKPPTPDQQMYLEQFARPLQLVRLEQGRHNLDVREKEFPKESPIGQLLQKIEAPDAIPLTKLGAYQIVRREPFGLQRPALLLILAALAADRRIVMVDEFGEPMHTHDGLRPDVELADFSAIRSTRLASLPPVSWKSQSGQPSPALSIDVVKNYRQHTIMIVDDDPSIHLVLELAVKPLGCRVEKAFDGIEALNKLQQIPIDLVISDLRMPNMTGIELFYQMQANPRLRDVPFIVLSSIDGDEEVVSALENGVEDYWIKPFRVHEITARIKRLFRRRLTSTAAYAMAAWPGEDNESTSDDNDDNSSIDDVTIVPNTEESMAESPKEPPKVENGYPDSGQINKILPLPAVSRLQTDGEKSSSGPLPGTILPVVYPPIPHPPLPITAAANSTETQSRSGQTGPLDDEFAIPSVTAEYQMLSEPPLQFEITDDEETDKTSAKKEAETAQSTTVFSIPLPAAEAAPIDIMLLYNQYWDCCRRVGNPITTIEYEDFKNLVISKAKKLRKQFNCEEVIFSVELEMGSAHVDCQVNLQSDYLTKQPKFRLL